MRPTVCINLRKISENARYIVDIAENNGISITAVTKMHRCDPKIVSALIKGGIHSFGDSRIENFKRIADLDVEKILIRIPSISQAEETVRYSTHSLISELETAKALSKEAVKQKKVYKLVVMFDVGDLREGYFDRADLLNDALAMDRLENIEIVGLGTNLTCHGGILPDKNNMQALASCAEALQKALGRKLSIVSGGNSTTFSYLHMHKGEDSFPSIINNIRVGDSILIGRDMISRQHNPAMHYDAFTLKAEVVELKTKPSVPIGKSGYAALNTKPVFEDRGMLRRMILSVGKQDIDLDITPFDEDLRILGASSDHLIIDATQSKINYHIGDVLSFKMQYTACLRAFTSDYVQKEYLSE